MPKVEKPKLYSLERIKAYDYSKTRIKVMDYFAKYRSYKLRIEEIGDSYNTSLSNDNLGVFSSRRSDPTSRKAMKIVELQEYIEKMDKQFKSLKLKLTSDEKVIFNYSILAKHSDEELAEKLGIDKTNIYHRKKSCFIKVAKHFNLAILNWEEEQ